MFVILNATEGPYEGKKRSILLDPPRDTIHMGRTVDENEFRLDKDLEISGNHATFTWNLKKDCLQIRDEKSFNGTALNSNVLSPGVWYDVKDGDTLLAGKSSFIISICDKKSYENSRNVIPSNSANEKDSVPESSINHNVLCPVCYKDLNHMTVMGRRQHVEGCLRSIDSIDSAKASTRQLPTNSSEDLLKRCNSAVQNGDYEKMSSSELLKLLNRMEDLKTKLEIQIQKVQSVYYRNVSSEMLAVRKPPTENYCLSSSDKEEALKMMFDMTQMETPLCSQTDDREYTVQSRLAGDMKEAVDRRKTIKAMPTYPNDTSEDSLITTEDRMKIPSIPTTPQKQGIGPRLPTVYSPLKKVGFSSPRRSSILVTPTKQIVQETERKKLYLGVKERQQLLSLFQSHIPPSLDANDRADINRTINSIVSKSEEEMIDMKNSINSQISKTTDPEKLETQQFIMNVITDSLKELEMTNQTAAPSTLPRINVKQPMAYRDDGVDSPGVKKSMIMSSPKRTVPASIEMTEKVILLLRNDPNLSNRMNNGIKLPFTEVARCVKESIPMMDNNTLQRILDMKRIPYDE